MKMFLVEHSYGAALIYAENADEAEFHGQELGSVLRVLPYDEPLMFEVHRNEPIADPADPDYEMSLLNVVFVFNGFEEDLEGELERYNVSLSEIEHGVPSDPSDDPSGDDEPPKPN